MGHCLPVEQSPIIKHELAALFQSVSTRLAAIVCDRFFRPKEPPVEVDGEGDEGEEGSEEEKPRVLDECGAAEGDGDDDKGDREVRRETHVAKHP